jgi:hypothetical protein
MGDAATHHYLEEFHKNLASTRMQNMVKLCRQIIDTLNTKINLKITHLMLNKAKSEDRTQMLNESNKSFLYQSSNMLSSVSETLSYPTSLDSSLHELKLIESNINENLQAFNEKAPANHLIVDDLRIAFYFQIKKIIDSELEPSKHDEKKSRNLDQKNISYDNELASLANIEETYDPRLDNSLDVKSFYSETPKGRENPNKHHQSGFLRQITIKEDSIDTNSNPAKSPTNLHRGSQIVQSTHSSAPKELSIYMQDLSWGLLLNEEDEEFRPFSDEKIYVILDKDFMKFRLKTNFIWNFF